MPHHPWSQIKHKKDERMTNPNKSHITIVADRSGSMNGIRAEAEGGLNAFVAEQKKVPGECSLYFVDFDGEDAQHLVYDGDIQGFESYTLVPRGMTPLNDAVAQAINETGERLRRLPEAQRPSKVYFMVQTDGQENASRETTNAQLVELVKRQEEQWKWTFIFLATGIDAFGQSQQYAGTQMATNVYRGSASGQSMGSTYSVATADVTRSRMGSTNVDFFADTRDEDDKDDKPTPPRPRKSASKATKK